VTVVLVSGLHLTCNNVTDHRGFRRDRHRRYLLIAVFALSITANRARGHVLYRQRSRDLRGRREAGGRAEGGMSGGDGAPSLRAPGAWLPYPLSQVVKVGKHDPRPWRLLPVFAQPNLTGPVHFVSISGVNPWPHLARSDYPWQFRIEVSASADEGSTPSPGIDLPIHPTVTPSSLHSGAWGDEVSDKAPFGHR
jgi:hypothetical protein